MSHLAAIKFFAPSLKALVEMASMDVSRYERIPLTAGSFACPCPDFSLYARSILDERLSQLTMTTTLDK